MPALAACCWQLMAIVLEPQDVPIFNIQTCCIWVTQSNCLRDRGRELLSKIYQRARSTGNWLCISHAPHREQDLSCSFCLFTVFNSLALHSLPPLHVQRKGCVLFEGVWYRRDPSGKSFWWHLAMRGMRTLGKTGWQFIGPLHLSVLLSSCLLSFAILLYRGHISTLCTAVLSTKRSSSYLELLKVTGVLLTQLVQYDLAGPHRKAWQGHCATVCHVCW